MNKTQVECLLWVLWLLSELRELSQTMHEDLSAALFGIDVKFHFRVLESVFRTEIAQYAIDGLA